MTDDQKNRYDEFTTDPDAGIITDIKINPDFFIHNAIVKAQNALTKENIKEGFLQFTIFIEQAEEFCKAMGYISEKYKEEITEYKKTDEFNAVNDELQRRVMVSNKKAGLLIGEIARNKPAIIALKA